MILAKTKLSTRQKKKLEKNTIIIKIVETQYDKLKKVKNLREKSVSIRNRWREIKILLWFLLVYSRTRKKNYEMTHSDTSKNKNEKWKMKNGK